MNKEQNEFLNMIVEKFLEEDIDDIRKMFWTISKEELFMKYKYEGYNLFKDFKIIIREQFGNKDEEALTMELISRIYDAVKWLN